MWVLIWVVWSMLWIWKKPIKKFTNIYKAKSNFFISFLFTSHRRCEKKSMNLLQCIVQVGFWSCTLYIYICSISGKYIIKNINFKKRKINLKMHNENKSKKKEVNSPCQRRKLEIGFFSFSHTCRKTIAQHTHWKKKGKKKRKI